MFSGMSTGTVKAAVIIVAVAALIGGIYWGVGSRLDEVEEPFFRTGGAFVVTMDEFNAALAEYAKRGACIDAIGGISVDESDRAALETLLATLRIERSGRTDVEQQTVVLGCPPSQLLEEPPPKSAQDAWRRVFSPPRIEKQDELSPYSLWLYVVEGETFATHFGAAPWVLGPVEMLCSGHSCAGATTGIYLPDTATADDLWRALGGDGTIPDAAGAN